VEEHGDQLKELIEEHSDYVSEGETPNEIEYLFDQCAKRDFVVRRGRNNRVMMRTIDKNVFNDNFWWGHEQDVFAKGKDIVYEEYTMKKNGRIMSKPRGNNLYSSRYDEVWKRKRSVKRSRKSSNAELCFQEYSKLKDYAM
jgi:hypothetical protein